MNNKGFSLVEIMTTFMLVSIILIMLIELLLSLKSIYKEGDLKTTLLINQANIEKQIYDDVFNNPSLSLVSCGENCINITTKSGVKSLQVTDGNVTYDNYSMKIASGSSVGELTFNSYDQTVGTDTITIFEIDLPITNKLIDGDYGIHIVAQKGNLLY